MLRLSRRNALALGGMAILGTAGQSHGQSSDIRTRQNILEFAKDAAKVAALRAGVGRMKKLATSNHDDPDGWYYWYAIHSTNQSVPPAMQGIYNQCDHSQCDASGCSYIAQQFLPWHRAFLLGFERTLKKAAAATGNTTNFDLPYWNWYQGPIPSIFTEGDENSNPLFHRRVNTNIADGLAHDCFDKEALLPMEKDKEFSLTMELDPHGQAHWLIGGDMRTVPKSAKDPIFWVHHANIDRLWDAWLKLGDQRQNPDPQSTWGTARHSFGADQNMVWTTAEVLDTKKNLKYVYDDYSTGVTSPSVFSAPLIALTGAKSAGSEQSNMSGMAPEVWNDPKRSTDVASYHDLKLGNQSVAVTLPLAATDRSQFKTFAVNSDQGPVKSAWIVLKDIRIAPDGREGGFAFNVYLTSALPGTKPVKIANVPSFNMTMPMKGMGDITAGDPFSITYRLDDYANEAGIDPSRLEDALGSLKVNFIAALPKPDDQRTLMTVDEVKLTTSPLATK